jgi:hypothetical protein
MALIILGPTRAATVQGTSNRRRNEIANSATFPVFATWSKSLADCFELAFGLVKIGVVAFPFIGRDQRGQGRLRGQGLPRAQPLVAAVRRCRQLRHHH